MRRRDPASLVQQAIWRTERQCAARSAHHVPLAVRLTGELDVRALVDACEAAVARHPILGAAFHEHEGGPWLGAAQVRPHVAHVDLSRSPSHRVAPQLADLVRRETVRPFDVGRGPLARFTLCRVARGQHVLVVVAHRLVFDGTSRDVLVRDLTCLYGAFAIGAQGSLPPLPPFRDHVVREQGRAPAALEAAAELWAGRWREPEAVVLPGLARPVTAAEAGGSVGLALDGELDAALDGAAGALGATRFEVLLAALRALLLRWGNAEPVVAADVSTRTSATGECIGPFANELPVGLCRPAGRTFAELVAGVRAELRAADGVREVPLASAVPAIGPRVALAPASMSYRRRSAAPGFPSLDTEAEWTMCGGTARNALHLDLVDGPGQVAGSLCYAPGAMERDAAAALAAQFTALVRDVVADPGARLAVGPTALSSRMD